MVNLQGVAQLTPNQAQRIYRTFGDQAWQIVSTNPYLLSEHVPGFGFRRCDAIARTLGIEPSAPGRLQTGILHVLRQDLEDGHLWADPQELLARAAELLQVDAMALQPQLDALISEGRITRRAIGGSPEQQGIYLSDVDRAESRVAERLAAWMASSPTEALRQSPEAAERLIAQVSPARLNREQREAIRAVLTGSHLVILTGGPGTGKTTTIRTLSLCLEALQVPYALCATTGRAAKQLTTATGRPAATVHRFLGLGPQTDRTAPEPIQEQVLVIDEASMIDLWLMDQIVARLGEHTHLFLVGDIDQLPPVGPGAVLHDLISASTALPLAKSVVVRLEQIFRQEAGEVSLIVSNCHRIRRGERPERPSSPNADYFEMPRATPAEALALAVDLSATRLPGYLGIAPEEVQVLAPVHAGEAGVQALNAALQARLNPPAPDRPELALGRRGQGQPVVLRVGDKVRQTRNDYQKRVFNGDLGTIVRIDTDDQLLCVRFDDQIVDYAFAETDDLVHAWAMTVHAAQGSQWPAVVVIMLTAHYVMLERNILYTALSRAQRLAVLISQEQAIRIALQRIGSVTRRTDLAWRLQAASSGGSDGQSRPG